MKTYRSPFKNVAWLAYRYITPFIKVYPKNILSFFTHYLRDVWKYRSMQGTEKIKLINTYPILGEDTKQTLFDAHYFYQSAWAATAINDSGVHEHVDVGSQINFIAPLAGFVNVTFIELRPLKVTVKGLRSKKGSILAMPYKDSSVHSLSCLHVAEHIGLGRYGDPLDPQGTQKACEELTRVLALEGDLYFSVPIGKERLCFNAHRIHSPDTIIDYFSGLQLVSLSGVDDTGQFIEKVDLRVMRNWDYGCGLFHFRKEQITKQIQINKIRDLHGRKKKE